MTAAAVISDESRHVAFGNVYLRQSIADMDPDDREDVAQFAFDAVKAMADATGGVDGKGIPKPDPGFLLVLERSDIVLEDFIQGLMEAGGAGFAAHLPPGHIHAFRDLMMPALVRIGAITDRTRGLLAAEGLRIYADTTVLEELEDAETGALELPKAG